MAMPGLHVLPRQLERLLPSRTRGLAFGIPALDALLPSGLARGQITAFDAPLGSGGTALLLALAETTLRADEGVAFVDAARSLAPQAAAHLSPLGRFWVIRPRGTESAWWCADILLRTGAFGLVIVDQPPAPPRTVAVRLQRLARDKDAALVVRDAQSRSRADGQTVNAYSASARLRVRASVSATKSRCPGIPGNVRKGSRAANKSAMSGNASSSAACAARAPRDPVLARGRQNAAWTANPAVAYPGWIKAAKAPQNTGATRRRPRCSAA